MDGHEHYDGSITDARMNQPFNFLGLSRELRDEVYKQYLDEHNVCGTIEDSFHKNGDLDTILTLDYPFDHPLFRFDGAMDQLGEEYLEAIWRHEKTWVHFVFDKPKCYQSLLSPVPQRLLDLVINAQITIDFCTGDFVDADEFAAKLTLEDRFRSKS